MKRLLIGLLVSSAFGPLSATAVADFTPPMLLSGTEQAQFTGADVPAISQNGLYVVFQGTIDEVPGIYRRDVQSGQVEPVAGATNALINPVSEAFSVPDATAPSISADGQFVVFTSAADLPTSATQAGGDQHCPNVYVRNMNISPEEPGAYTLASALGAGATERAIAYAECGSLAGSQAASGVALSGDGQQVVFTVLSPSNLGDPECAESSCLTTPASQVAVRNLQTKTTTIVSVAPDGEATPGGGAYPSTLSETEMPRGGLDESRYNFGDQFTGSSAAISADGSTVAWLGTNVSEQVPGAEALGSKEVEPLWRRIADGASAVTKRLLGDAGLDFLYFPDHVEADEPVTSGSLVSPSIFPEFIPPALSADGRTVAVLSNAPTPESVGSASQSADPATPHSDAYLVHVDDSSTQPAVTRITEIPAYNAAAPSIGNVKDLAISADGTRVAFDTTRTEFAASSLALISPPIPYEEIFETYEANLTLGTLQRVVSSYNGSTPDGNAGILSFSESGQTLVFASQATNLFFGDAIGGSQVYAVNETPSGEEAPPQILGAAPALDLPDPVWTLSATAIAQADGSVIVDAEVPGYGRLGVSATAQLPVTTGSSSRIARRGRKASPPPHHKVRTARSDFKEPRSVAIRASTLAAVTKIADGPSVLQVRLRVASRYHALVAGKLGLYAIVRVSFTDPGHVTLTENIPVTFRTVASQKARATERRRPAKTITKHGA